MKGREGKGFGEGAVVRKNQQNPDETPRKSAETRIFVAAGGGKALKGGQTARGFLLRGRLKRTEPQDRQRLETQSQVVGGESRRRVEKTQGRNEEKVSQPFFRKEPGNWNLGVDSSKVRRWRGGLWKPQERKLSKNPQGDCSTAER